MTSLGDVVRDRWLPVRRELMLWSQTGRQALLWVRDDDAVTVTPNLKQLIAVCGANIRPLIACVPKAVDEKLSDYLRQQNAEVAVHGWSHTNHQPSGVKAQEFPLHRGRSSILSELQMAQTRLQAVFQQAVVPVYVPPWNRIDPEVAQWLPELGFTGVSTFGAKRPLHEAGRLRQINTHVDIIDWANTRGTWDLTVLVAKLATELARTRHEGGAIGILTHHLVHDTRAWQFLDELVEMTGTDPAVRWCSAGQLLSANELA